MSIAKPLRAVVGSTGRIVALSPLDAWPKYQSGTTTTRTMARVRSMSSAVSLPRCLLT